MQAILMIVATVLYFLVGAISLLMAIKLLTGQSYLPFHRQASGLAWEEIEPSLQAVILTLMIISGLGFLVTALILLLFPAIQLFYPSPILQFVTPVLSLIFWFGMFLYNYRLYKATGASTPWKKTLYAIAIIEVAFIISMFS